MGRAFDLAQRDFLAILFPPLENLLDFFVGSSSGIESASGKTLITMDCFLTLGEDSRAGVGAGAGAETGERVGADSRAGWGWGSSAGFSACFTVTIFLVTDSVLSLSVSRVILAAFCSLESFPELANFCSFSSCCSGEGLPSIDGKADVEMRVAAEVLRLVLRELGKDVSDLCRCCGFRKSAPCG